MRHQILIDNIPIYITKHFSPFLNAFKPHCTEHICPKLKEKLQTIKLTLLWHHEKSHI